MATQIKLRRDTSGNWTSLNPVLALGEPGYETNTGKLKIGDGVSAWNTLSYFNNQVPDLTAFNGHIVPGADNTYDLGSPTRQWRHLYVANGSLYIGDIKLSNDNGQLLVQQVTDAGLITEAPVPNTPGVVTTDRLVNGQNTFVLNADGTLSLNGGSFTGGGSGIGIGDFGDGFSLDNLGKIVTRKLYSTSQLNPNQHYRLELDANGVIHLPDQSIINGATLKSVPGNYAGITAGPAGADEDSWMWVDSTGAFIATKFNTGPTKQWSFDNDGVLTLPEGGDIRNSTGTSVLGGGNANLGNYSFSGDIMTIPMGGAIEPAGMGWTGFTNGTSAAPLSIVAKNIQGNYSASLTLQPGNQGQIIINTYNEDTATGYDWYFDASGQLSIPGNGSITQNNTWTKSVNSPNVNLGVPTVVWSSTQNYISSAKLTIQVECSETGDTTGWHSQACEAVIACRGASNIGPTGDPQMVVYGVVHTSVAELATFTVQRNPTTKMVEVVATLTPAASNTAYIRIHSVELGTRD